MIVQGKKTRTERQFQIPQGRISNEDFAGGIEVDGEFQIPQGRISNKEIPNKTYSKLEFQIPQGRISNMLT